jgi:hypothetical protein
VLNPACARAHHYGNLSYRAVKKICERELYNLPLEEEQQRSAPPPMGIIRNLSDYRKMTELGVIAHE